jgi:hypothetical protein
MIKWPDGRMRRRNSVTKYQKYQRGCRDYLWKLTFVVSALSLILNCLIATESRADEDGTSFWLNGSFGSLSAIPLTPGWSVATIYYHTSVTAGGNVAASREFTIGNLNPTVNITLNANLEADADLVLLNPCYVFASPVLGGQLALGITGLVGHNDTSLDGTLTLSAGRRVFTRHGTLDSTLTGVGDLFPQTSLRWNSGVNNFMTYMTGGIPVGDYSSTRLANLGIGHGAFDGGVGYTYLDPKKGHELSAVAGMTYNFENPDTGYRSGADFHLDWGASQFLSEHLQVGAVGYLYDQISGDTGGNPKLGDFKSRVAAVGPQIGYVFPIGKLQGYMNVKGYWEFASQNRPEGWNLWVVFSISPPATPPPVADKAGLAK